MKSIRSASGKPVSKLCSRQGGRVLSISKFSFSAMPTKEFSSAECSQPQPRSKVTLGAAMMVWPRPPTRSRASSTITDRPESFSACAAPRPAAPAPMMATSMEEGRDVMGPSISSSCSRLSRASTPYYIEDVDGRDKPGHDNLDIRSTGPGDLRHRLLALFRALAIVRVEEFLAQPDRFRRHLDQLVVLDIGQRLFQRHPDRWGQAHRFVLGRGADVGKLLAFEDVNFEIVVAGMLADDHALVDLPAGLDHHRPAVFQLEHRVGDRLALIVGDQDAIAPALDFALVSRIAVEQAVHDRGAAGVGEQFALVADQAAGRCVKHQPQAIAAGGTHLDHLGLALAHLLHDDAGMLLVDVDHDFLDRLLPVAGRFVLFQHDARTRYRELEALASHGLDQDRELQFAAARYFHGILVVGLGD